MRACTIVVVMTETAPALFDRLADRYDQVIPFFAEFARQLLDVLDPEAGTRLLGIGSGRGAIAAAATSRSFEVVSEQRGRAKWPQVTLCRFPARSSSRLWRRRARMCCGRWSGSSRSG
jgi:hypothetical protein